MHWHPADCFSWLTFMVSGGKYTQFCLVSGPDSFSFHVLASSEGKNATVLVQDTSENVIPFALHLRLIAYEKKKELQLCKRVQ
jgi:hypothetical protein